MSSIRVAGHRVNQSFPKTQNQSRQRLRYEGADQRTGEEQNNQVVKVSVNTLVIMQVFI